MKKGPLPKELRDIHSERIKIGQARARAAGKSLGRPSRYSDIIVRSALRRHDEGQTWAAIAETLGIPVSSLYDRLHQYRQQFDD